MGKIVPYRETEHEIVVVNSRFIGSLTRVASVEQAREYIKAVKSRYPDAHHHVSAFVIGHGNSVVTHSNDDGEPSGTAGRPALAVLQGSGLGDTVAVVTRYFGGTKLGTGGLVRAYGEAVREVIKATPMAEIIQTDLVQMEFHYPFYERVKRIMARHASTVEEEQFTEKVILRARMLSSDHSAIKGLVTELTSGSVDFVDLERQVESLLPVNYRLEL